MGFDFSTEDVAAIVRLSRRLTVARAQALSVTERQRLDGALHELNLLQGILMLAAATVSMRYIGKVTGADRSRPTQLHFEPVGEPNAQHPIRAGDRVLISLDQDIEKYGVRGEFVVCEPAPDGSLILDRYAGLCVAGDSVFVVGG